MLLPGPVHTDHKPNRQLGTRGPGRCPINISPGSTGRGAIISKSNTRELCV